MSNAIPDVSPGARQCEQCAGRLHCAFRSDPDAPASAVPLRVAGVVFERGETLCRQGEPAGAARVLKSGSAKVVVLSDDGLEQIVGFRFAGDLIDPAALAAGQHRMSAVALETAAVCRVAVAPDMRKSQTLPTAFLLAGAEREIVERNEHLLVVAQRSAKARLAWFLLDIAGRYAARGYCGGEFNLTMSRNDIANYLALAIETVSRLFSDFARQGILQVQGRLIRIESAQALARVAGAVQPSARRLEQAS